jgi:hypothetical protein
MFLRPKRRSKDCKEHTYWSLAETVRTRDGPRQTSCYLSELVGRKIVAPFLVHMAYAGAMSLTTMQELFVRTLLSDPKRNATTDVGDVAAQTCFAAACIKKEVVVYIGNSNRADRGDSLMIKRWRPAQTTVGALEDSAATPPK